MSDEKLIETKFVQIRDESGKSYSFEIKVSSEDIADKKALIIQVEYSDHEVLYLILVKDAQSSTYATAPGNDSWDFNLPENLRGKGIGERLWKELERVFLAFDVTFIGGSIGYPGYSNNEIQYLSNFWKRLGFYVSADNKIQKSYALQKK